jgi:hypothetical protein
MIINPMAIGMFVVPDDRLYQKVAMAGLDQPAKTPANMAKKIQRVRYRSRNFNLFCEAITVFY